MGSHLPLLLSFFFFFFLLSSAHGCQRCAHQSKVNYFSSSYDLSNGACGYGSMVTELSGGYIAAGSSALFKDGLGCGGCFQVRCKNVALCSTKGVKVILTDRSVGNGTDLFLSKLAYSSMAKPGKGPQLHRLGVVDAEYRRIPCKYPNHNLSIRVEERSQIPNNLTIRFLYQGGQTEIVIVDVAQVESSNWQYMSRRYGAVWSTDRAPPGPLQFRMVVTGGYDGKWIWADKAVLPSDWKAGVVYDTGVRITDIAMESCYPCDTSTWR